MFLKSSVGFMLSNCLKAKKKNTFGIQNTQYSMALSVHKQPSVFNIHDTSPNNYCQIRNKSKFKPING